VTNHNDGQNKTYQEIYRESAVTLLRLMAMCFVSARVLSVLVPNTMHRSLPTLWQLTVSRRRLLHVHILQVFSVRHMHTVVGGLPSRPSETSHAA